MKTSMLHGYNLQLSSDDKGSYAHLVLVVAQSRNSSPRGCLQVLSNNTYLDRGQL